MFFMRLRSLAESSANDIMFREQKRLHELGFKTLYGKVWKLAQMHGLDLDNDLSKSDLQNACISYSLEDIKRATKENLKWKKFPT